MKHWLLILTSLCLLAPPMASAQRKAPFRAPEVVKKGFEEKYPDLKVGKWALTRQKAFKAYIKTEEKKGVAYFTRTGNWMRSKWYLKELPLNVEDSIYTHYDYPEIKKIIKNETPRGITFLVILDTGPELHQLYISEAGKILKRKVKKKTIKKEDQ